MKHNRAHTVERESQINHLLDIKDNIMFAPYIIMMFGDFLKYEITYVQPWKLYTL